MSLKAITLKIEGREVRIDADVVKSHFLDQRRPVSDQPEQYEKAVRLLEGLKTVFTNDQGEFILGGYDLPQDLLLRNRVVPGRTGKRILQARERREAHALPQDQIHIEYGQDPNDLPVTLRYQSRFNDFASMRDDLAKQTPQKVILFKDQEDPIRGRYDATFTETWVLSPQGITETSKRFDGLHVHHGNTRYETSVPPINLIVSDTPSARAVNRMLTVMFAKFAEL